MVLKDDSYALRIRASIQVAEDWIFDESNIDKMRCLENDFLSTLEQGKNIYFFGNGGSAAEASHLAAEFVGKCLVDSGPNSAFCLNDSLSVVTAIANDWSFSEIFSRQIKAHCKAGDLVIGLSTSGSTNVIEGLTQAFMQHCKVWLFTSKKFKGDENYGGGLVVANTKITSIAQELHLQIGHAVIEAVEKKVAENKL
jgi:D-sedoheptulose 7-phosphate isomerase